MSTEKDAAKNVRQLFERALTTVGLHTIKGAIIWEAFREFEIVLFALVKLFLKFIFWTPICFLVFNNYLNLLC